MYVGYFDQTEFSQDVRGLELDCLLLEGLSRLAPGGAISRQV